jgi:hypothetical protein
MMWLAKIVDGVVQPTVRVDDFVTDIVGTKEVRRPRTARAWRIKNGAAAISQSPEGAIASARSVLEQPDYGPRVTKVLSDVIKTMLGAI